VADPPVSTYKPEGEYRVSQYNGDIYAAAADAMKGGKLILDRTVVGDTNKPLVLTSCMMEGMGKHNNAPKFTGNIVLKGEHCTLRDLFLKGAGQGIAIESHVINQFWSNIRIENYPQSVVLGDGSFYGQFDHVVANIGIGKGLNLATPTGSVNDNGQFIFNACKFDGGAYALKRDPALAATMHRILFNQTQFSGGYAGEYIVDGLGLSEIGFVTCDIELSGKGPTEALVRIGGAGTVMLNCALSAPTTGGIVKKGIVTTSSYSDKGTLVQNCTFNYMTPDSVCITPNDNGIFIGNYVGIKASGATIGPKLYSDTLHGTIIDRYEGFWMNGKKIA
jgi:hypothetical protein